MVRRALEVHVAPTTLAAMRHHVRGAGLVEVGYQPSGFVKDHRPRGHLEQKVGSPFAGLAAAGAIPARGRLPPRATHVVGEIGEVGGCSHHDGAAAPAVAAVGAAAGSERFAAE